MLPYLIALTIFLGIVGLLLAPVSLKFDSALRSLQVRWMGLSISMRLAGKKPRKLKERPQRDRKHRIGAIGATLFKDRDVIFELLQRGYHLVIDVVRSLSIRELQANFSTSDPMWNGVLYGIFSGIHFDNVDLSVNFQNINSVKGWFQLYPYKLIKVAAGVLIRLPYRRIVRAALDIRRAVRVTH